jgi:hypothetical protein
MRRRLSSALALTDPHMQVISERGVTRTQNTLHGVPQVGTGFVIHSKFYGCSIERISLRKVGSSKPGIRTEPQAETNLGTKIKQFLQC